MDQDTTVVVVGLAVVALLGAIYLLTKPKPSNEPTLAQWASAAATVAAMW
jgi:hypothetical protein